MSSCKSHCYDDYLIPDTFDLPEPTELALDKSVPSSTDSARTSSSWETYLMETSQHRSELATDRKAMRDDLLTSMKQYYGNQKWRDVPTFGDTNVEYVADEPKYQDYTDQIVLFGEEKNIFRRRYIDRRGYSVPTKEFDIVKLDANGNPRPSLMKRMSRRMKPPQNSRPHYPFH